jgi:predicted RNase H-like HicB family nuclease
MGQRHRSSADALCDRHRKSGWHLFGNVPDLPGCIATGDTVEAVEREIRDAIRFHVDGLREDGLPVPEPHQYRALCRGLRRQATRTFP